MRFSRTVAAATVRHLLGREPNSEHELDVYMAFCPTFDAIVERIAQSDEYKQAAGRAVAESLGDPLPGGICFDGVIQTHKERFLAPDDLTISKKRLNVLLIGQCFFYDWTGMADLKQLPVTFKHYVVANLQTVPQELTPNPDEFDFQVVHIPMRGAVMDTYLKVSPSDEDGLEREFTESKHRIDLFLDAMLTLNKRYGLETYVCGFIAPQKNLRGRFAHRYHLSNMVYFVEQLNRYIFERTAAYKNAYYVDFEGICSVHGKKFSRNDFAAPSNHGGQMTDGDAPLDAGRLVPTPPASTLFAKDDYPFVHGAWCEIEAMHRTLHAIDLVKMIVIDLDDTLWRGLVGEGEGEIDGWPTAFIETLNIVKNRGILLAIISKNDETVVRRNWARIVGALISIDDFAVRRINYQPKAANMAEILEATNLLAKNVVFIDDNPVERESMKAAFPEIRLLGDLPLYFKRVLLWSAETQVATLSSESINRTAMMQAQVAREIERKGLDREEFLHGLGLAVDLHVVRGGDHRFFARAFELINKTNQFNTTGRRLTLPETAKFFEEGGAFYVFDVRDKHTPYGIVGVIAVIVD